MKELTIKELLSINGGGPIWIWLGKVVAHFANYPKDYQDEVMAKVANGEYIPD
jgi:bacteriocin-like protein